MKSATGLAENCSITAGQDRKRLRTMPKEAMVLSVTAPVAASWTTSHLFKPMAITDKTKKLRLVPDNSAVPMLVIENAEEPFSKLAASRLEVSIVAIFQAL